MYFITAFGALMVALSFIMITKPNDWSNGIIAFSKKPWFHWFEVLSRTLAGAIFIFYYEQSLYPNLIKGLGYLLIAVGIGLIIIGPQKHKKFAVWSAEKFRPIFRVSGIGSFCFGIFLIYISSINSLLSQ